MRVVQYRVAGCSAALCSLFLLAGCEQERAPSILITGSYFPSWMLCAVIGLVATVFVRVVLIRVGLDDWMPFRVLAYTALALAITFALLLAGFPR